jgi:hypothetical protein
MYVRMFHAGVKVPVELCFFSSIATHLRPLLLGCCEEDGCSGIVVCLIIIIEMQLIIGIFLWYSREIVSPP